MAWAQRLMRVKLCVPSVSCDVADALSDHKWLAVTVKAAAAAAANGGGADALLANT